METAPLSPNCFNAVQLYWGAVKDPAFLAPEDFISYLQTHFSQVTASSGEPDARIGDVSVIWTRTSEELPHGEIRVDDLQKKTEGYPFGLVIEHAFVLTDDGRVFHKRDATEDSTHEMVTEQVALQPYLKKSGFEITRHRRRPATAAH